jgi:hypothetical protein
MSDWGLQTGTPQLQSIGAITFGPDDILFIADNAGAQIIAVDIGHGIDADASDPLAVDDLGTQLAAALGCDRDAVAIRDLAVHPRTQDVFLSVQRGGAGVQIPVLLTIDRAKGALSEIPLADLPFATVSLPNAPSADDERTDTWIVNAPEGDEVEIAGRKLRLARPNVRASTVTDMAYVDGTLIVAGMSNEEFSSNLRRIAFPFTGEVVDNSTEIFHVSHGMWETAAPIRTFVPYEEGRSILASYTCTPLVHLPLGELTGGTQAKGRTVAELGAGNQPLDMISFTQGGDEYLLISHSSHPLMKVACRDIDTQEGLTEPQAPVGTPRQELDLPGVSRLANFNGDYVLAMQQDESGARHLRSLKTASL